MRILITSTLFLFVSSFLSAQQSGTGSIKGIVRDASEKPVSFATVVLNKQEDGKMEKASYTDENGLYEITDLNTGWYVLEISFVGFENFKSEPVEVLSGQLVQLSMVTLKEQSKALEEVVVTAQRPIIEVKPDKLVFNVEGTVNATGHTALELLRKTPKVVLDNNNNLIIQGKSGVNVYIDGKPSPLRGDDLANFLQNMQSNEVDAIEIITNPSSRYDAQGNAGIINIRLKRDKNLGTNGSVNLGYAIGIFPKYNGSVSLNHRNKVLNAFGSYAANRWHGHNFFNLYRIQYGEDYDQRNTSINKNFNQNAKLGLDLSLGKKQILGFLVSGYFNDNKETSNSHTDIRDTETQVSNRVLVAMNDEEGTRQNLNYNINYRYDISKEKSLNVDLDYGQFQNEGSSYQPNRYYDATEQILLSERINTFYPKTDINIATAKADYEQPLWKGKLGVGVKVSRVNTDNDFLFYNVENGQEINDPERSNRFEYTEQVNAGYFNYQSQFSEKVTYQLGLRVEQTNSIGDLTSAIPNPDNMVERNYTDLFPSAGMTWQASPTNSFQLTFSRRIDRPSYQDLNPFQYKLDELSYRQGNARLRPQYTNSVELGHVFKYTLNTSLSVSRTEDMFAEITDAASDSSAFIKTENLARQDNISLNVSYPYSPTKWWNSFTNVSAFRSHTEADFGVDDFGNSKIVDLDVTTFNFYSQHTFLLPEDFSFEISGWFNSPSVWGGVHKTESMWSMDAGIQKKLWKGKANLKLTVSDIFFTQQWRAINIFGGLTMKGNGGWESRQFRVNFTYNFGSQTVKGARKRKTGMEDENSRIKG